MRKELEDIVNRADALFYEMRDIAMRAGAGQGEREAVEDKFDSLYAEAMRLIARIQY